jgi:hypothetical protein
MSSLVSQFDDVADMADRAVVRNVKYMLREVPKHKAYQAALARRRRCPTSGDGQIQLVGGSPVLAHLARYCVNVAVGADGINIQSTLLQMNIGRGYMSRRFIIDVSGIETRDPTLRFSNVPPPPQIREALDRLGAEHGGVPKGA